MVLVEQNLVAVARVTEVVTRCDERAVLEEMGRTMLGRRLAACAHVRGPVASVYRWQGAVVETQEWELDAVTTPELAPALEELVLRSHPYELPAVLVREVGASRAYAAWVRHECASEGALRVVDE